MTLLKAGKPSRKEQLIASVRDEKKRTKRTTFNLPTSLHKKLKQKAAEEETNVTDIIIKLANEYVNK